MRNLNVALAVTCAAGLALFGFGSAFGEVLHWRGTTSKLASVAENWVDKDGQPTRAPEEGDAIVLDADSADKPMTWDVNEPVASWTQTADYTGTVTFQTGISRKANGTDKVAYGALAADGVTRVLKVTGDVTINGGTWTHEANPTMKATEDAWIDGKGIWRLIADIGGNLTVGPNAKIDVTSKGYVANQGPGAGDGNVGGSHGGIGMRISVGHLGLENGYGKRCYGSIKHPVTIGSCARDRPQGGGAIVLDVGGSAKIDGGLLANAYMGSNAAGSGWGSGAGGSIFVKSQKIEQTGTVQADGGIIGNCSAGGGGRIAFVLTGENEGFAKMTLDNVTAYGGKCTSFASGHAGTIYLEKASDDGRGELIVKNRPNDTKFNSDYGHGAEIFDTENPADSDFSKVTLLEKGGITVCKGAVLKTDEFVTDGDTTMKRLYLTGGTLDFTGETLANPYLTLCSCLKDPIVTGSVMYPGKIRINGGEGGLLRLVTTGTAVFDAPLTVEGDVVIPNGVTLTHTTKGTVNGWKMTTSQPKIDLVVIGDMAVDAGGKISVTGGGYPAKSGEGKPMGGYGYEGASHGGGSGGYVQTPTLDPSLVPPCYGSIRHPTTYGSGSTSFSGGGVIKVSVSGVLTLDGTVESCGPVPTTGGCGSAGGSIWIIAKDLVSTEKDGVRTGAIHADGGKVFTGGYYGASGGGRVAVTLTDPAADFSSFGPLGGRITAYGSTVSHSLAGSSSRTPYGAAGTVYLRTGAQGETGGTLIISNGNSVRHPTSTCIGSLVTDTEVGSVCLCDNSVFEIKAGNTLTVNGGWTKTADATLICNADSHVVFKGEKDSAATIGGSNAFFNVSFLAPGKTFRFGTEGSCFGILTLGTLTLTGDEESPIVLRSVADGTVWPMDFASGALADVTYADIRDSANAGATVVANKSVDSGNNTGWNIFQEIVAGLNTWTGAVGTDWDNAGNWSQGRAPIEDDEVVVRAGESGHNPVLLTDSVPLKSLTVTDMGMLTVNATLTVKASVSVAGDLEGSGTLLLNGATADFAGADINLGALTVVGGTDVSLDLGGDTVGSLLLTRTGGKVSFPNGAVVTRFTATATDASTLEFGANQELRANEVRIDGLVGEEPAMRLQGAGDTAWKLNARGLVRVNGVRVSGSQATGLAVGATSSEPVAGAAANERWTFSGAQRVWTGAAGTADFHDAANWGGILPGAEDTVIIPSGADIVATAPVEIGSLYVDGGALRFSNTVAVLNAVEIGSGATVVLDAPATVGGAFNLRSGATLTHTKNGATALYRIDLTVANDMTVEPGATIDLMGRGFAAKKGPGAGLSASGGSHGGVGCDAKSKNDTAVCYGSIRQPITLGSGGESPGGGAAKFTVDGTFRMDGTLNAEGNPSWVSGTYLNQYVGAGGSCWVTCGTLTGAGTFNVNGGRARGGFGGAGGRFALWQTVATTTNAFTGTMTAYGTMYDEGYGTANSVPNASCGTVFIHNANDPDDGGLLVLDDKNGSNTERRGDYPSRHRTASYFPGEDGAAAFRHATVLVTRGGSLYLTEDVRIDDLIVHKVTAKQTDGRVDTQLRLNGFELKIYGRLYRKGRGWWTPAGGGEVNPYEVVTTPGNLFWYAPFMLITR